MAWARTTSVVGPVRPGVDAERDLAHLPGPIGVAVRQQQLPGPGGQSRQLRSPRFDVGQRPVGDRQIDRLPPPQLHGLDHRPEGGRGLAAAVGVEGHLCELVEPPQVGVEPLAPVHDQRVTVGLHEEGGVAAVPFGLERPEEVGEGDAEVAGLALGVELGPQVGCELLARVGAPQDEVREQVAHPTTAPLGRVDRTAVPAQLDRPEEPELEAPGGRDGEAGERGAGRPLVRAAGRVGPAAHVGLALRPEELEEPPAPAVVGRDLGQGQLGRPGQREEGARQLGLDAGRGPERAGVTRPQGDDGARQVPRLGEVGPEVGGIPEGPRAAGPARTRG